MRYTTEGKGNGATKDGNPRGKKFRKVLTLGERAAGRTKQICPTRERKKEGGSGVTARQIRESLIEQLKAKGADSHIYMGLIEDYVWFWQQEREMQKDIKDRGRTYMAMSAAGREYEKNNPSVKDALLYSKQMVAILDALDLSTKTVTGGTPIEEDDDM